MTFWPRVKQGLLALYLLACVPAAVARTMSLGLSPGLAAFVALWAGTTACLLLGGYARSVWARLAWALLFAAAGFFVGAFEAVTGQFLTYDAFITMISSTGDTGNALAQYGRAFLVPALLAAVLAAAIVLKPRSPIRFAGLAPLAALLCLSLLLYVRGGEGARGLPAPMPGLAYAALAGWEAASEPHPARQPVALRPAAAPPGDLVFVIDESVAPQY